MEVEQQGTGREREDLSGRKVERAEKEVQRVRTSATIPWGVAHLEADDAGRVLSKLDRFEEAQELLPAVRTLSRKVGGELDQVRLKWTEGRVAAGRGRLEEGLQALVTVRGAFATRHARHMVPIFRSQEVHREALAALTLFRQAAEQERVTAEFAREVLVYLRKARYNSELRFEGKVAA
jgi:hypothetical protein